MPGEDQAMLLFRFFDKKRIPIPRAKQLNCTRIGITDWKLCSCSLEVPFIFFVICLDLIDPGHSHLPFICRGICRHMLVHLVFMLVIVNNTS